MINIAIDGPSGGGKSTLAKSIAKELGYIYVDTGALYRSIALYMIQNNVDTSDKVAVIKALDNIDLDMRHENGTQQVYLNGVNVGDTIRTPEVAAGASTVSAIPEVRTFLLALQRNIAKEKNVIMDGRDIGTVILPDAQVKIFLSASMEARARRRHLELQAKGIESSYEEILAAMLERDTKDSTRETAPAVPAEDAIHLDNSDLDPAQTLEAALNIIRSRL